MYHDWQQFHASEATTPAVVDPRRRLRICLIGFLAALLIVFGRAVQLEWTQGAAFRSEATRPLSREKGLPGVRGRILASDGTVLACDQKILALAVHYRYLQEPPDAGWLRRMALGRLSRAQRKDARQIEAAEARVRADRSELAERLARLCGLSMAAWRQRASQVQSQVERIAQGVQRRRGTDMTVAEELDCHVMAEDVSLALVAEIEGNSPRYPGVKIVQRTRRAYPFGPLAAHVLGHLGPVTEAELQQNRAVYDADDYVGRMGLESRYESLLRGHPGVVVEQTNRSGRILATYRRQEPGVGRDLVLTVDPQLQRAAESLLDSAAQLRTVRVQDPEPGGGAIVVIDVRNGAVRAAASSPRFDPNLFVSGKTDQVTALLRAEADPLFDRVVRMAIPPGSVFKTVSAVALLEAAAVDPRQSFFCQGYLDQPDRQRCAIYRRRGVGHGEVTLADALAVSCNVYFFHHGGELGPGPLADWARRFGFGQPTGIDLPGEAAGIVPTPETAIELQGRDWQLGDTQSLAIGQGSLTATPLQVVRMMAAVANGGRLVTPHVVSRLGLPPLAGDQSPAEIPDDPIRIPPPQPIPGLRAETLDRLREGLERCVADPAGTAHATVYSESLAVAGKTGTAETGGGRADHAWFAGYVPAERPRLAFVVVLEHAGESSTTACLIVQRLVQQMQTLGMLPDR